MNSIYSGNNDKILLDNSFYNYFQNKEKPTYQTSSIVSNNLTGKFTFRFDLLNFTPCNSFFLKFGLPVEAVFSSPAFPNILRLASLKNSFHKQSAYTYLLNSIKTFSVRLGTTLIEITSDELNKQRVYRNVYLSYNDKKEKIYGLRKQSNVNNALAVDTTNIVENRLNFLTDPGIHFYNNKNKIYDRSNIPFSLSAFYLSKSANFTEEVTLNFGDLDPFFKQDIILPPGIPIEINIEFSIETNIPYLCSDMEQIGSKTAPNSIVFLPRLEKTDDFLNRIGVYYKSYIFRSSLLQMTSFYHVRDTMAQKLQLNIIKSRYDSFKFMDFPITPYTYNYKIKLIWQYFLPDELIFFIYSKNPMLQTRVDQNNDNIITNVLDTRSNNNLYNRPIINFPYNPTNGFELKKMIIDGFYKYTYESNNTNIFYGTDNTNLEGINDRVNAKQNKASFLVNSGFLKIPITTNMDTSNQSLSKNYSLDVELEIDPTVVLTCNNIQSIGPTNNATNTFYLCFGLRYKSTGYISNNNIFSTTFTNI